MNADTEFDALGRSDTRVVVAHRLLHFNGTSKGVDDAEELDQQTITSRLDNAAPMLGDLRLHNFESDRPQTHECPFLFNTDKPAVAGDIRRQDRR